ncbi:hypothetical protein HNR39_002362 [Glaciimonas immobilis]|uniref:Uncharacterized protein n=1 Tax=Glaciimonas immobilis TaxID=728004 RepID=A0A840RVK2_9BURK|nr:hypothetical protein [Glaciimonas immobilis]
MKASGKLLSLTVMLDCYAWLLCLIVMIGKTTALIADSIAFTS